MHTMRRNYPKQNRGVHECHGSPLATHRHLAAVDRDNRIPFSRRFENQSLTIHSVSLQNQFLIHNRSLDWSKQRHSIDLGTYFIECFCGHLQYTFHRTVGGNVCLISHDFLTCT